MGDPIREAWVAAEASGRSFADIGGLWGTVNEQVSVAAAAGAASLAMVDVTPFEGPGSELWDAFHARCADLGVTGVRCISGDLHDPGLAERVGIVDVVHCSGVLYHSPHPLHLVQQLAAMTGRTLILSCATIPERVENDAGLLVTAPGSALLVPALDDAERAVLGRFLDEVGAQALGINVPVASGWTADDYAAWWWCPTPRWVRGLLEVAGLRVRAEAAHWAGRATLFCADRVS